jgi:hypothetical protein
VEHDIAEVVEDGQRLENLARRHLRLPQPPKDSRRHCRIARHGQALDVALDADGEVTSTHLWVAPRPSFPCLHSD